MLKSICPYSFYYMIQINQIKCESNKDLDACEKSSRARLAFIFCYLCSILHLRCIETDQSLRASHNLDWRLTRYEPQCLCDKTQTKQKGYIYMGRDVAKT